MSDHNLRQSFMEHCHTLAANKAPNLAIFTIETYERIVGELRSIHTNGAKKRSDYNRIKRFELDESDSVVKLKVPGKNLHYLHTGNMYDAIHSAHLRTGHGGRDVTMIEMKTRYANVNRELVQFYLNACPVCRQKRVRSPRRSCHSQSRVVRPAVRSEFNERVQVDLIDMQTCPDGDYRYVMVYQENLSKFCQLRPLKTKTAAEICEKLTELFSIFGAPKFLHTDNGSEFEDAMLRETLSLWPECRLVRAKPKHFQSQGSVERLNQDVQEKLSSWMSDNPGFAGCSWSKGLPFVQYQKNICYHSRIKRSPYEVIFGSRPVVSLELVRRTNTQRSDDIDDIPSTSGR